MRILFYIALLVLISCQGKNEEFNLGCFSGHEFSLDTALIATGDEVLFLKHGLISSGIGKDLKYFYNFNEDDVSIEKINLDELRLEEKLPFEREGPNGIGAGMGIMRVLDEKQVSITGMYQSSLFSMGGEKLMTVYYENFSLAEWHMGGDQLKGDRVLLDPNSGRLYGLIQGYDDKVFVLGILNLDEYEISRMELKSFGRMPKYSFTYKLGKGSIIGVPLNTGIDKFDTKVILSNEITNALMWYDTEVDSLFMKSYKSQLTSDQKEREYKKEHETPEQFEAEFARYREEINYMSPFWDNDRQRFYRFSYEENNGKVKVYLTAFDKNLDQIGEALVPQLIKKPAKHFVKEGKIWIYENMDDEMAFVRLGIEKVN